MNAREALENIVQDRNFDARYFDANGSTIYTAYEKRDFRYQIISTALAELERLQERDKAITAVMEEWNTCNDWSAQRGWETLDKINKIIGGKVKC